MNVLIAEDEPLAAERLQGLLYECDPSAVVVDKVDSVSDIVSFFKEGKSVDLVLLDIQLADGKSLEVFDKVIVEVPIIFTTAFDEFALEAFKLHSIDYILKPVQRQDLQAALTKLRKLTTRNSLSYEEISQVRKMIVELQKKFKERFIIRTGNKLLSKPANEVAVFFADGKNTYLVSKKDSRKYLIDHTLEELEQTLDPSRFFRISRKHIVAADVIGEVRGSIRTGLHLLLTQAFDQNLSVSRDRANDFKRWLDQ
jgi:DNA-binding LytR/AlgR family response regulator